MSGEDGRQSPEQPEGAEGGNREVEEEEDDCGEEEEQRSGAEVNEPVHPMEGFEPVDRAAKLQKSLQSTINQKREEQGPTSKTTMSGEHGRQGPEQPEGAEGGNREGNMEEAELNELGNNLRELGLGDPASPRRQRKPNKPRFTVDELETLKREMEAKDKSLYGSKGTGITTKEKKEGWQHLNAAVNAVGGKERTVEELKRKSMEIKEMQSSLRQCGTATGGGPSTPDLTPIDTKVASIIGTPSVSHIVSKREGDTDKTEEQESADGGEKDDDAGEGHPAAPTPSTNHQSAGRVLTDAVLQLQRETIDAVNNLTEEMRQIRNVITEIAKTLKDARG